MARYIVFILLMIVALITYTIACISDHTHWIALTGYFSGLIVGWVTSFWVLCSRK